MSEPYGVIALGNETAAMFALEARARGLCAAWAPQRTVDDFRLVGQHIWAPDAMADLVREGADRNGLSRDEMERDIRETLDMPSVHTVVFIDEIPRPGADELFYRRKMKKAIALLGKRGRVAMVTAPDCSPLRLETNWLNDTKRYWKPILRTCLPLYGADGKPRAENMAGMAKIVFMLIASSA